MVLNPHGEERELDRGTALTGPDAAIASEAGCPSGANSLAFAQDLCDVAPEHPRDCSEDTDPESIVLSMLTGLCPVPVQPASEGNNYVCWKSMHS